MTVCQIQDQGPKGGGGTSLWWNGIMQLALHKRRDPEPRGKLCRAFLRDAHDVAFTGKLLREVEKTGKLCAK